MPGLWLLLTMGLFIIADALYRKGGCRAWLHPTMLPTIVLIVLFYLTDLSYVGFVAETHILYAGLLAAVAALAVPLFRNLQVLRAEKAAVIAAITAGSVSGVGTATGIIWLLNGPGGLYASVVTKSVTTPIAVTVADAIGGSQALAAAVVIVTGLSAAICGPWILNRLGVDDEAQMGVALGTAGHAIGMAEAVRRSELMGASAAFAMAANGLATAIVMPLLWRVL
ncbi:LrgB family protein [Kordiimonas aestuarii]|uniref:LrgB family protein n=1 Tax=Kordiimonas aestuarii TaxID=1005925 RepID=UPI0021D38C43|nr:LrgB family protein [Kordiimonas aestuarii]